MISRAPKDFPYPRTRSEPLTSHSASTLLLARARVQVGLFKIYGVPSTYQNVT